jgi:hypothetical protein
MNREEWLGKLTEKMRLWYPTATPIPDRLRLTCGWPSKGAFSAKKRRVGECWTRLASGDNTTEVFISPCVADSAEVGAILAHELVHACGATGHRASFKRIAESIGLEGPMRSTVASTSLKERLNALVTELGPYPHAVLDKTQGPHKKDGTRLIKCVCCDCGYTVRTTRKWLEHGFPLCPNGTTMEEEIKGGDSQ